MSFWPSCQILGGHQDILISLDGDGKWPDKVQSNSIEGFGDLDGIQHLISSDCSSSLAGIAVLHILTDVLVEVVPIVALHYSTESCIDTEVGGMRVLMHFF